MKHIYVLALLPSLVLSCKKTNNSSLQADDKYQKIQTMPLLTVKGDIDSEIENRIKNHQKAKAPSINDLERSNGVTCFGVPDPRGLIVTGGDDARAIGRVGQRSDGILA